MSRTPIQTPSEPQNNASVNMPLKLPATIFLEYYVLRVKVIFLLKKIAEI